jgi:hypothetical protein
MLGDTSVIILYVLTSGSGRVLRRRRG